MKKLSVFICGLLLASFVSAQNHELPNSYFNGDGLIRLETQELLEASDSLVNIYHRSDDVVWSRIVYRIVDMRFKQNYQLYTPLNAFDSHYSSLLKVIFCAATDKKEPLTLYRKDDNDFKPYFDEGHKLVGEKVQGPLKLAMSNYDGFEEEMIVMSLPIQYDKATDSINFEPAQFEQYAKNQLKYLLQEIIFFDKHYSRLYTKILAIAPLHSDKVETTEPYEALKQQVMFWIPFDKLRPYMARQYMLPHGDNDAKRVTFDEFFTKKLYSSYIIDVSNVYDRMILQLAKTHEQALIWQQKIEWEMLTLEQDLWEY